MNEAPSERDVEAIRAQVDLIHRMVDESREVRAQTGHIYVGIGALFVLAALFDGIAGSQGSYAWSWVSWPVAGVFAGVISFIGGRRQSDRQARVSYAPRIEGVAWMVTSAALWAFILLGVAVEGQMPALGFPVTGLMVAIPLAVSAALYRYWPLAAGAAVFFVVGIATAFMGDLAQRLGFALAMLLGYVGPGLAMMRGALMDRE